jgi:hypothetical protein
VVQENPVGRLPAEGQGSWEHRRDRVSTTFISGKIFLHRITISSTPAQPPTVATALLYPELRSADGSE